MLEEQIEIKPNSKMVFRRTDSDEPFDVTVIRTLSDTVDVGYMYEVQFINGNTEHVFHNELLPYTKMEAYKGGHYKFKCSPVSTYFWNDNNWIDFINAYNGWTVQVV